MELAWPTDRSVCQRLLEDHQVVPAVGVPTDADDVVTQRDRQVQHRPVLVVALEADRVVLVLPCPAVYGVHELSRDPLPATVRDHPVEPAEEYVRLELEADEKPDGLF